MIICVWFLGWECEKYWTVAIVMDAFNFNVGVKKSKENEPPFLLLAIFLWEAMERYKETNQ